jgi:hypothetical protein
MASSAGLAALTAPRDLDRVRREIVESGYRGERVVLPVPTDFPSLKALGDVGADLFRKVGLNVDYQAADPGTVLQRLAKTEPVDRGGWSAFHTYWSGLDQLNPAVNGWSEGRGPEGTWTSKTCARLRTGEACHRRWTACDKLRPFAACRNLLLVGAGCRRRRPTINESAWRAGPSSSSRGLTRGSMPAPCRD